MKNRTFVIMAIATAMAVPAKALDDPEFKVAPGLYAVENVVVMAGQPLVNETMEYCITPEQSSVRLSALLAQIDQLATCELRKADIGPRQGQADMFCQGKDLPLKVDGRVKAEYQPQSVKYSYVGRIVESFIPAQVVAFGKADRIGECPSDDAVRNP